MLKNYLNMMNLAKKTNKFYSFWTTFIFCLFLIFYGHFLNQQKDNLLIDADVKINNLPVDISAVSYLVGEINSVSYTHLTLPTNREV